MLCYSLYSINMDVCAFKGFCTGKDFLHFQAVDELPKPTLSNTLCWIPRTVSYANSASCCTSKQTFVYSVFWTASFQGITWCIVISSRSTPSGVDMEAQHFSQQQSTQPLSKAFSLRHALSNTLFINQWTSSCSIFICICLVHFLIVW